MSFVFTIHVVFIHYLTQVLLRILRISYDDRILLRFSKKLWVELSVVYAARIYYVIPVRIEANKLKVHFGDLFALEDLHQPYNLVGL